ncbi:unnamed protein product [Closterium sp. Naga37s-1]|nr:unnamed protein product [Closterium sp. Naga37s-1]
MAAFRARRRGWPATTRKPFRRRQRFSQFVLPAEGALLILVISCLAISATVTATPDYRDALSKALLFFDGQRSGNISGAAIKTRTTWRGDSGLTDGKAQKVDLVGGYYDGAGNVKYGLPLAFSLTLLSWATVDYQSQLAASGGQLFAARDAIRWGMDYLLKAHTSANELWVQVGDGPSDDLCWQRPEDMTTDRTAYRVNATRPGSDVAGETAAAMAAASLVFAKADPSYSSLLLNRSQQLFTFADTYRGVYSDSIPIARRNYPSWTGYEDELAWAAAWLHRATGSAQYLEYLAAGDEQLQGSSEATTEFSWDDKFAGAQVLVAKVALQGSNSAAANLSVAARAVVEGYRGMADAFACAYMPDNPLHSVYITPGGLVYIRARNSQYATSAAFLLLLYSDYLASANRTLSCDGTQYSPADMAAFSKSQVDYLLGVNPLNASYMVGFGQSYPQKLRHRAASIVSFKADSTPVTCEGGKADWLMSPDPNPNVHVGAIVGGPDADDAFMDDRQQAAFNEPSLFTNAAAVGALARLAAGALPPRPLAPSCSALPSPSAIASPRSPPSPAPAQAPSASPQPAIPSAFPPSSSSPLFHLPRCCVPLAFLLLLYNLPSSLFFVHHPLALRPFVLPGAYLPSWCLPSFLVLTFLPGAYLPSWCLPSFLVLTFLPGAYLPSWCLPSFLVLTFLPGAYLPSWCLPSFLVLTFLPGAVNYFLPNSSLLPISNALSPPTKPLPPAMQVTVTCTISGGWTADGKDVAQWGCSLTNTDPLFPVTAISLLCSSFQPQQYWNIDPVACALPDWARNLGPGGSASFGFIQEKAVTPQFSVLGYFSNAPPAPTTTSAPTPSSPTPPPTSPPAPPSTPSPKTSPP